MSISLQKGQKVSLVKDSVKFKKVIVGLGWKAANARGTFVQKLFKTLTCHNIDCDASVLMLRDGKLKKEKDIVYYNHLEHKSGAVKHMGDNLVGNKDSQNKDAEQIKVNLGDIPKKFDRLVFVVNIYRADDKQQHFGMIDDAYIQIVDQRGNKEICRFNLTEDYSSYTGIIVGEMYRGNDGWEFNVIGEDVWDSSVHITARRYS